MKEFLTGSHTVDIAQIKGFAAQFDLPLFHLDREHQFGHGRAQFEKRKAPPLRDMEASSRAT